MEALRIDVEAAEMLMERNSLEEEIEARWRRLGVYR